MRDTDRISPGLLFCKSSQVAPAVVLFVVALLYLLLRVPGPEFFLSSDDQGYQMALGMAIATGRYPGLDFITQYGPLVAVASWLGWAATGSLAGEIFLCAAGYAATIALTYRYLARHANVLIGVAGALTVLALFPRFYKWYYWLLPILTMSVADRFAALRGSAPGPLNGAAWTRLAGWGVLVGFGGLFRYDLLAEGIVFGVVVIAALEMTRPEPPLRHWRSAALSIAAYIFFALAAPVLFGVLVWALRGSHQLGLVLQSVVDGTGDTVAYYLIRPFRFGGPGLLSLANVLAFLQLAIPVVYLGTLAWSVSLLRSTKPARRSDGIPLLCAALMGLGIFPQALHRADLEHLLQIIPPLAIVLGLLLHLFLQARPEGRRSAGSLAGFAVAALSLAIVAGHAGSDLGSPARNPFLLWERLDGLPNSAPNNAIADIAKAVRRLTPADSTVFLVMPQTKMAMLYFARRHQPGLFPTYEVGMFASPFWLAENEAALKRTPPDYLVLARPGAPTMTGLPAPFIPDLLREWQQDYRRIVYENSYFLLLSRSL
jgi:hypothetical protein